MEQHINAIGHIELRVFKGDRLLKSFSFKNLVVGNGKQLVTKLLAGAAGSKPVTKVQVGTNGTAAANGDTAITSPISAAFTSIVYPATNQVQFKFNIPAADVGGSTIREIGLLNDDNVLFARKATPEYDLPEGTNLIGTWTITINS